MMQNTNYSLPSHLPHGN